MKKTLANRCLHEARKPSNWIKGGVGLLVLTLVLTWLVPKLLDASWGRLCKFKEESDKVPALVSEVKQFKFENSKLWHYAHEDDKALTASGIKVNHTELPIPADLTANP